MDWRCEWCGKPHAENDPPCDNCGHGTFERAVVPVADDGEGVGSKSTVWVCTECGREHTKHTPPCKRCGSHDLEKRRQEFDEAELEPPGYTDLLTPRYAVGIAVALALAAVFVAGAAGVVNLPLPGFDSGVPGVSDVPGNATSAGSVDLGAAEEAYVAALSQRRAAAGSGSLTRDDRLDRVATFYNQRRVKADLGAGSLPSQDRLRELLSGPCGRNILLVQPEVQPGTFDSAADLGERLAEVSAQRGATSPQVAGRTGVDFHALPDGRVYVTQFVC